MGRRCEFADCQNVSGLFPELRTYHGFPKDAALCRRWVANCGNPEVDAVFQKFGQTGLKQRKVCSDHFSENELTSGLARRPVPGAVPRSRIQVASGQVLSNDDCRSHQPTSVNWAEHETVDMRELDVPDKPSFPPQIRLLESDRSSGVRDDQGSSGVREEQDLLTETGQMVSWTYLPHNTNESIGMPDENIELELLDSSDDAPTHHLVHVLEDGEPINTLEVSWIDRGQFHSLSLKVVADELVMILP